MSVVNRSPFEYLLNAPAGGGVASAFQEGEAAASRQATEAATRAESALRRQKIGLDIGEFQAGAPLREAERQRMLGLYRDEGEAPTARLPGSDFGAEGLPSWLIGRESGGDFGAVNADTGASGRGQFMESRLADARRAGVIPETMTLEQFRRDRAAQVRVEQWHVSDINNFITRNQLDQYVGRTVAGIPITSNGMLAVAHLGGATGLKRFLETGGRYNPADANGTRLSDYMLLGARAQGMQPQAAPQGAATPAPLMSFAPGLSPATPQPRMPSMLSAPNAGMSIGYSPAGVPITEPDANLPDPRASNTEAVFNVPMYNAPPQQATVSGTQPAAAPSGARSPFTRLPGAAPVGGPVEPSQPFTDWLAGQAAASQGAYQAAVTPGATPAPDAAPAAAPAPAPSPFFTTTPEAIAQAPVTTNLAALGITPVGRAPAGAPAAAPATAQPALPSAVPGLTVSGPALLGLQQVQAQRAQLQRQYDRVRLAPPGERAALRAQIEAANTELIKQERNYQVDIAVGQLSMGQWQPINNILRQTYGIQVRPVEANGQIAGYDLVQGGRTMARVTPEQLGSQVRLGLSQTFAQQEAARNQALFDANIEGLKEALKAKATAAAKIAEVEANARTRGFSQVQKLQDDSIVAFNPSTGEGFRYRQVPVPGGKRGEMRDEIIQLRANVPVR